MIKSYKARRIIANTLIYILLAVLGFIWICPFIYLVLHSFRDSPAVISDTLLPKAFTFQNYIDLFTKPGTLNFGRMFMNTLVVAIFSCIISTISVLMVSYTFSRLRFKARKPLINVGMIMGMFPGFMTMIALYYILKMMGLDQTLLGLILCYSAGSGLGYLVMKGYLDTIPHALDEAATIDGANQFQVFYKIILPMAKPMIIYQILTSFISPWCDFILVRLVMQDNVNNYTVSRGLWMWTEQEYMANGYYRYFLAGSVVVSIPITALFLYMQKYYVEGVTAGGVKG